jgi:hypothetical protein
VQLVREPGRVPPQFREMPMFVTYWFLGFVCGLAAAGALLVVTVCIGVYLYMIMNKQKTKAFEDTLHND